MRKKYGIKLHLKCRDALPPKVVETPSIVLCQPLPVMQLDMACFVNACGRVVDLLNSSFQK